MRFYECFSLMKYLHIPYQRLCVGRTSLLETNAVLFVRRQRKLQFPWLGSLIEKNLVLNNRLQRIPSCAFVSSTRQSARSRTPCSQSGQARLGIPQPDMLHACIGPVQVAHGPFRTMCQAYVPLVQLVHGAVPASASNLPLNT